MSIYVISDIHGKRERFLKMLKRIGLGEDDTLYILGDVIDRGADGVAILEDIMRMKNVRMLLGNHEYMCLRYFSPLATSEEIARWGRNGNAPTLAALDRLSNAELQQLLSYLAGLEDHVRLSVNGREFYLVHGWPGDTLFSRVWGRPEIDAPAAIENVTVIVGHTPVCYYISRDFEGKVREYSRELTKTGDHFRILHAENFIDIDCCCAYDYSAGRLACLRLDDMAEFYE